MKDSPHDPRRLDVRRFAAAAGHLEGNLGAADLPRLVADAPLAAARDAVWSLDGEQRGRPGAVPEVWLRLRTRAAVMLTCQRCLQPMAVEIASERSIRFVADEAEAERLDEHSEDDVLAWPARGGLDALDLIEDELILSLPLVPRHEACPQPLTAPEDPPEAADAVPGQGALEPARPNPFAVLAALKRPRRGDPDGGAGGGA